MQGQTIQTISDANINGLLTRRGVSLLLITSSWDGHGIIIRSLLESVADRYKNINFGIADVEESPRICKLFNVANPPGLLFVKDGELVNRVMGAVNLDTIRDLINRIS